MAALKNAIKVIDPTPDKKSEHTLLVTLLGELCEQHRNRLESEIRTSLRTAGEGENQTVPIERIIGIFKDSRAYVRSDAGKIADEVSKAVKQFVNLKINDIVDGIAGLLTVGLNVLVGSGVAEQRDLGTYYITADDVAVVRYDVQVWSRKIEVTGLTSAIESAMAIVAYRSSVKVSKVSLNTFRAAYGSQLNEMKNLSAEDRKKYLEIGVQNFKDLGGGSKVENGLETSESELELPEPTGFIYPAEIRYSTYSPELQLVGTTW